MQFIYIIYYSKLQKGKNLMANTTNFSVRMDVDIKKQCEIL